MAGLKRYSYIWGHFCRNGAEGAKKAIEQGLEQGIKEGIKEGKKEAMNSFAEKLVRDGFSNVRIAKLTKLRLEEVMDLRKSFDN